MEKNTNVQAHISFVYSGDDSISFFKAVRLIPSRFSFTPPVVYTKAGAEYMVLRLRLYWSICLALTDCKLFRD